MIDVLEMLKQHPGIQFRVLCLQLNVMVLDAGDIMLYLFYRVITGQHKKDLIPVLLPQLLRDCTGGHSEHGGLGHNSENRICKTPASLNLESIAQFSDFSTNTGSQILDAVRVGAGIHIGDLPDIDLDIEVYVINN